MAQTSVSPSEYVAKTRPLISGWHGIFNDHSAILAGLDVAPEGWGHSPQQEILQEYVLS